MAAPPADVIEDLNKLITTATGFKESQDNFKACLKYSVSHFVHHTYPSISKSTVKQTLEDYETRMLTHGQFKLREAFIEQTQHFLSCQDTFKSNPECQIEWGLLSFVTALSRNLSTINDVPPLLPVFQDVVPTETFDWATYLKDGLPAYSYNDTASFSSSSSDEVYEDPIPTLSGKITPIQSDDTSESSDSGQTFGLNFRQVLDEYRKQRDDKISINLDIKTKGDFALKWEGILLKNKIERQPLSLISEETVADVIVNQMLSGGSFDSIRLSSLSFLTLVRANNETFRCCLNTLEPYAIAVGNLNDFINTCSTSLECSVVEKAYASCLKSCLMRYEMKLLAIRSERPSLFILMNELTPIFPFIGGLFKLHKRCVVESKNEHKWQISLRILTRLHNGMLENQRSDLRLTLLGMFLCCLAVFGEMVDVMLTSSYLTDRSHEFFMFREMNHNGTDCIYKVRSGCAILDEAPNLVKTLIKLIEESSVPLSLVFLKNRFASLSGDVPTMNQAVYQALHDAFFTSGEVQSDDLDVTNEYREMAQLVHENPAFVLDFLQVPRWLSKDTSMLSVSKVIEEAVFIVVTSQLEAVRNLAWWILVNECKIERNLTLLRNVLLINDASLLLPMMHVLFTEEESWNNAEYLTLVLRECVSTDFPDLADELTVTVAPSVGLVHRNIIEAIDCVSVHYNVPYPVSLVITPELLKKYNEIFRVLLKLKWAHTLCRLPFPPKNEKLSLAARAVSHRLQIVRFSCLADLNIISNYFMAQATASLPYPCADYLNIQSLISDHESLISNIHARCMLSEGDQNYNLIFDTIIPVCFDLRTCWSLQEAHIVAKLKVLEHVNGRMHGKLMRLMPLLERETYVPLAAKSKEDTMFNTFASIRVK